MCKITLDSFKVELINKEEVKKFIENHGKFACVCYNTNEAVAKHVGRKCLESGHMSGSRADLFKFKFTGIPRFTVDQCVRHEVGSPKNVQSLRYVNKKGFNLYYPPEIMEDDYLMCMLEEAQVKVQNTYNLIVDNLIRRGKTIEQANEIARTIIPIGVESSWVQGFTLEALIHFVNVRLCLRAEKPARAVAKLMVEAVQEVTSAYDEFLVPKCEAFGYCVEDKCCGLRPTKAEFIETYNIGKRVLELSRKSESDKATIE